MGLHNRKGRVQRMRENDFSECYPHIHPLDTLEAREYMIIHWRILSGLRSTRTDVKIIRSLANVFDREKLSECICYVVSYMARVKSCKFANGSSFVAVRADPLADEMPFLVGRSLEKTG